VAGRKNKGSWPRCGERTWRGPCQTASVDAGGGPCQFHRDNPVVEVVDEPDESADDADVVEPVDGVPGADGGHVAERVDNLRAQLARDIGDEYALLRDSLLEGLQAVKDIHVTCRKCTTRNKVVVPDMGARVRAVEALLNQTAGRPREEVRTSVDITARIKQNLRDATDEELLAIIAAADEVAQS